MHKVNPYNFLPFLSHDYQEPLVYHHQVEFEDLGYSGPDHGRIYSGRFVVGDRTFDIGKGRSKKESKKEAANFALAVLGYSVEPGN